MQAAANQNPGQGLLERLEDIHSAAEPSWWPPAPGWWFLAALLLAILVYLGWRAFQRFKVRRRRRNLIELLDGFADRFDPAEHTPAYLAAVNSLIRAVALRAFPEDHCARLEGVDWVRFLQSRLPDESVEGNDPLSLLAWGPYQESISADMAPLNRRAREWVLKYG